MNENLLAILIVLIIGCPEIAIVDKSGRIRFQLEGFICMIVRTIRLQSLLDEVSVLIEKNNQALKTLKEIEVKKSGRDSSKLSEIETEK